MTDKLRRLFKKQRKHKIRLLKDALTKHKTRIPGEYLMDLSDHLPELVKNDDHNNNSVETLVYIEKKVAIKFVRVQVVDLPSHKYPNGQEGKTTFSWLIILGSFFKNGTTSNAVTNYTSVTKLLADILDTSGEYFQSD